MTEKVKKIYFNIKNKKEIKFVILAIILIAIFCIAITPKSLQNDTFYTIKIGEHISQYGVDMQDPFSWHEDLSYTYPHWLYDLLTYYIYSAFGMAGIYTTTCILSAILGLSIYFVNKKLAKNQLFSFFITIGAMYLIKAYIAARAQLVTFILFIWTIYFIEKFIETKKIRYGIPLLIIPILIANLHTAVFPFYFVLFLPYIAEYLCTSFFDIVLYRKISLKLLKLKVKILEKDQKNEEKTNKITKKIEEIQIKNEKIKIKRSKNIENPYKVRITNNKNVKWLILIMVIAIFTGLLTPLGNTPYTYLVKTMEGNTTQNINEHLPMTLADEVPVMCTLAIFLAILIFTKAKIKLSDLFLICGLGYLMLKTKRQVSLFAIIGTVVLNRLIMECLKIYVPQSAKKTRDKTLSIISALLITCVMLTFSFKYIKEKKNDQYISESSYPVKACDYILQNIDLGNARFYNEYNYGSYMIYRGIPVFIDSRADLYAPEFNGKEDIFMDFIDTSSIGKFYEDTFKKYNITHVITYENSKTNMIITKSKDKNYKQLYKDKYFVIYERLNTTK